MDGQQNESHITRAELRGSRSGKLRGNDDGEQRSLKEYPDLCEPENNMDACKEISNPGIDGMEGVYKKASKEDPGRGLPGG